MNMLIGDYNEAFDGNINKSVRHRLWDGWEAQKFNAGDIKGMSGWIRELIEAPVNIRENILAFDR